MEGFGVIYIFSYFSIVFKLLQFESKSWLEIYYFLIKNVRSALVSFWKNVFSLSITMLTVDKLEKVKKMH